MIYALLLLGLLPLALLPGGAVDDGEPVNDTTDECDLPPIMPDFSDPENTVLVLSEPVPPAAAEPPGAEDQVLLPTKEDDVDHDSDVSEPDPLEQGSPLAPVNQVDQPGLPGDEAEDVLAPIVENDSATEFSAVKFAATTPVSVEAFEPEADILCVYLNPDKVADDPDITVKPSADGVDSLIYIDGVLVAILKDQPNATIADIYAEFQQAA